MTAKRIHLTVAYSIGNRTACGRWFPAAFVDLFGKEITDINVTRNTRDRQRVTCRHCLRRKLP